jgi:nucleoside-diphosphate-sugar epimerase
LVLMSSLAVHASTGHLDDDESAPRDRTDMPYALSKRLAEDYVLDPELDGKLEGTVIRPGLLPFGPRDHTTFDKMARALRAGRMPVTGLGDSVLCTVYARNLAFGTALAGRHENGAGEVFVITDDVKTTWKAVLDRFADALGAPRTRLCVPRPVAQAAAMVVESAWDAFKVKTPPPVTLYRVGITLKDFHFTCDKAKRVLGYRPPVPMDQAVHETAAWFLAAEPDSH